MLLIILTVLILILFIFIYSFVYKYNLNYHSEHKNIFMKFIYKHEDGLQIFNMALIVVCVCTLVIMFISLMCVYIPSSADKYEFKEKYNSLIYKAQTESIRDEFGIMNKSFLDEIQDWNMDVARNKELTNNIWIGIFYPDWLNELETIDLNSFDIKE